jgi:hypothetical protein
VVTGTLVSLVSGGGAFSGIVLGSLLFFSNCLSLLICFSLTFVVLAEVELPDPLADLETLWVSPLLILTFCFD